MSENKVHGLFYTTSPEWSAKPTLMGLFATRELAEKRLLTEVLYGNFINRARIDELEIEGSVDPKDPTQYPEVIQALLDQKKIQAIKELRIKVPDLLLREAKELVEAVDLSNLPEATRHLKPTPRIPDAVFSMTWSGYLVDGDDDLWVHRGEGKYSLLFPGSYTLGEETRSYSDIERNYTIDTEGQNVNVMLPSKYRN